MWNIYAIAYTVSLKGGTMGLYICGFPSGAFSQEIVLEYPRGYKAIGFRVEKKTRSLVAESSENEERIWRDDA